MEFVLLILDMDVIIIQLDTIVMEHHVISNTIAITSFAINYKYAHIQSYNAITQFKAIIAMTILALKI
jgi:hypothetical protein